VVGMGTGVSSSPRGGKAKAYRLPLVARETGAAGGHERFEEAFNEVLNRQLVAMEPKASYGLEQVSKRKDACGIGELISHLERKYKLTEAMNE
jgi:hypothetical protein